MRRSWIIPILLAGFVLSLPIWLTTEMLAFRDFGTADILQLLTGLFVVSLLLERSLEVFVTTWRGPGTADLDLKVGKRRNELEEIKKVPGGNVADAAANLARAEEERTKYKSDTQRGALWTGLTFGLLVSAVGVRSLQTLVDGATLSKASHVQVIGFHLMDVLLTGGLIAGGSEGIHKITQVFTNYMEISAKRIKDTGAG
jgi:hypothetical protein